MRFLVAVVLVVGFTLSPAGCGGDSPSADNRVEGKAAEQQPDGSARLSTAEFRGRVGEICNDLRTRVTKLSDQYFSPAGASSKGVSSFAARTTRELRKALSDLAALTPPARYGASVESLERAVSRGIDALRRAAESSAGAEELLRGSDPFAAAKRVAGRLGLRACVIRG